MVSNNFICSLDFYVHDTHEKEPNQLQYFLIVKANW